MFILNEQEEGTVFAGDTSIRNIIEKVYPDAWKQLLSTLPKNWFKTNTFKHYPIVDGAVILPKDFYRLYSFKMTGWKNKAFETVEENSEKALLQQNEYTRGGIVRPVCVLTRKQPEPNIINGLLVEADSDTSDFEYLIYNNKLYYVTGHLTGEYDEEATYVENDIYYSEGELYKVILNVELFHEIQTPINGFYTDGETYYSNGEIIDYEPGLMDVMEVYPEKGTIEEALYIPNPANDDEISEKLFEPLCKTAAQLVYIILEKEVKLW